MVNKKISELAPAATITGTEVIPLVQAGTTVAATVQQLLALIVAGAPGNLDTFFEVATQMGLDEAAVTTLQALVASKADAAQVAATYAALDGSNRLSIGGVELTPAAVGLATVISLDDDGTPFFSATGTTALALDADGVPYLA